MATVSHQSAFWAVVALGVNMFTQDGGKVLGFLAEYSRALRLSPIVCIVDTWGVLITVAVLCYKIHSFKDGISLAARYRCLTEEDRAEPRLERTWWFRLSVFALGALPQAVKILGMDGIKVTKIGGMAYLVSFLVLEGLNLLQPRQHRDYDAVEMDVEEVLDGNLRLPGSLAVFTQHLCFLLQLCLSSSKLDLTCDMDRGNCPHMIIIGHLALVVLGTAYLVVKHIGPLLMRNVAPLLGDLVEWGQIAFWLVARSYYSWLILMSISIEPTFPSTGALFQMVAMILFLRSAALPFALDENTFENRWFRGLLGLIRWFRELSGLKISEKGDRHFSILFAAPNIASIICYYVCIYDPSSTYKPPWTEYLG